MTAASFIANEALALAHRGLRILPCWWPIDDGRRCACGDVGCGNIGKHPLGDAVRHGCHDATTDPEQIRNWWARYPHANVAIATGIESGVVGLDRDDRHGGDVSWEALESRFGRVPYSVRARSGSGGLHVYLKHPGGCVRIANSKNRLGAGIDVRGDGGYLIASPSLHASGCRYEWLDVESSSLDPAPGWLLALFSRYDANRPHREEGPELPEDLGKAFLLDLLAEMPARIKSTRSRHNTAVWLFQQARDNRVSRGVCEDAVSAVVDLCRCPGDRLVTEQEVGNIIDWAFQQGPRQPWDRLGYVLARLGALAS